MTGEELGEAVKALIESHPRVSVSPKNHAKHADRYLTADGAPIGREPGRVRFQNLWVRADSVNRRRLRDLEEPDSYFDHTTFATSKPNHDLFGEPAFKDCDLIRYRVRDLWQAARIIAEVAGDGGPA